MTRIFMVLALAATATALDVNPTAAATVHTVKVGDGPAGLAVTPDGKAVYVTNQSGNSISVIDTATNTVSTTMNFPARR